MAVFLDTGIIVALDNKKDSLYTQALEIMKQILSGAYGNWAFASDYVFDEALALSFVRTGNIELAKNLAKKLLALKSTTILHVDENAFQEAIATYLNQKSSLSFTDCTTIELMKLNNIEYLATFDAGFKKIPRITVVE